MRNFGRISRCGLKTMGQPSMTPGEARRAMRCCVSGNLTKTRERVNAVERGTGRRKHFYGRVLCVSAAGQVTGPLRSATILTISARCRRQHRYLWVVNGSVLICGDSRIPMRNGLFRRRK